ncbi:MAG: MarR family transcriptional regulator [Calditrichaceae bacterium]
MNTHVEFKFNKPEESPGYLLWQLNMLWQRKIKRELDKIDITHTQFVLLATLAWLEKEKEDVTQTEIASHSKTDRMMVSKVLRTLQRKGYLTRTEHETDTRAKVIKLTDKGRDLVQKALKIVEKEDGAFFSFLGSETQKFNSNLNILIKKNL